ncbi:MAG: diadenylate cyclase CdaA [Bacteroidetes bacterium]|nr:diadenylate cyclase CdaA [Bacteroidota bacterium]
MKIFEIGFLVFSITDVIDILLVAFILYMLYKLVKRTIALNIFLGFLFVYVLWFIVRAMNMRLLSSLLGSFIEVGAIALLIIFQQEIRRFLLLLGKKHTFISREFNWKGLLPWNWQLTPDEENDFEELSRACKLLSKQKTGALIVVGRTTELNMFAATGTQMDADVSAKLLESIFVKNAPLHDGAVIIEKNKILAASCILPVTDRHDLPTELGLRHRSAIGLTEQTDAFVIILSEETGKISFASKGEITLHIDTENLTAEIEKYYGQR